jgi:hypothetical protein
MPTIEVSQETYEKIKDQLSSDELADISSMQDLIGKKWFIRTVTYHWVGKAEKLIGQVLIMSNASWVADSGRFMNAIKEGVLEEVEPVGMAGVNLATMTDIIEWKHDLPKEQK